LPTGHTAPGAGPLSGQRAKAHWPHTTGPLGRRCLRHSGASPPGAGPHPPAPLATGYTAPGAGPPLRPHWGRRGLWPKREPHSGHALRGAATGPLPSLAIRGGPTPGGGCTPALLGAGPSLAIGLWATGRPLATYWPSGEGPLATDWQPTPTGLPLRGGHTPLWPLTGHWLHHTGSGEPLSGHRAKTPLANFGHTLREAQLHGQRGPHPRLATYRPIGPTGEANLCPLATRHRVPLWPKGEAGLRPLATYGHTLREVASPLTGQRRGRAPLGEPHPSLATHWPPTGHKGTGKGRLRPALPPLATYAPSPTDWPPLPRLPRPPLRCLLPSPTGGAKGGGTGHLWPKGWG